MRIKMTIQVEFEFTDSKYPEEVLEHCVTLKPCCICGGTKDVMTFKSDDKGEHRHYRNLCMECAKKMEVK